MTRIFSSTLLASCLLAAAAPAAAADYYKAEPAAAPSAQRLVVRDLVWRCGPAGCVSGRSNSRAAVDCAALVRQVGAVRSFTVEGRPLAPEDLEKCNARAR
ncbi:MAG: hypothetical protein JOZ90_17350 [Alphaproteobacteria bacterium]|nr:hypothetical protein [Alphaproteobacteria bacterium]MBV9373132.1 hypothetical protein [Alphaproteobacteria bacterium]MBV9902838.1 hypothetical protein [Alphaproteobacteria bacterium]